MKKAHTSIILIILLALMGISIYSDITLGNLKKETDEIRAELEEVREIRISEENKLEANPLFQKYKSISVCIDAGHGITKRSEKEPVSPGSETLKATNVTGAAGEEEFNLAVANLVEKKLKLYGFKTDMTRTTPECDKSNIERAEQGNKSDYFIRIHADGSNDASVHGISVLVPEKSYYDDADFAGASKELAQCILDAVVSGTDAKNNGLIVRGDLTGFNWSKVPAVLIECGFLSNPEEKAKLHNPEYRDKLAEGIAEGFLNYINKM